MQRVVYSGISIFRFVGLLVKVHKGSLKKSDAIFASVVCVLKFKLCYTRLLKKSYSCEGQGKDREIKVRKR